MGKLVSGDLDSFADWRIVRALVSNNRLGRFLKRQGYTTYSVSNQYHNVRWRSADHYVSEWWFLNQFEDTLLGRTPVPWLSRWLRTPLRYELHRRRNEYNLDATIRLVPEPGPKFVFVHLLSPHAPFVVGPEGEPRNPARPYSWVEGFDFWSRPGASRSEYIRGYRDQIAYLNKRLLAVITRLQASDKPPVIILQSDHGPAAGDWTRSLSHPSLVERFGILSAFYLPGEVQGVISSNHTAVNTFRIVLNRYFGASLELLEGNHFYVDEDRPHHYIPIKLAQSLKPKMGIYLTQVTTRCRIGEMEDYPRNLAEFEARFATEQAGREYLCQLRWPEGFRCPRCGHDKAWAVRTALLECAGCGHQASPTAGTIFQDTRQPLQSWFRAMWWLTSQKNGASALGLQRVLGLGSYKTAWTWLHKLRRAMVRPGRDRLSGRVEVDETYLGGLEEGVRGRQTDAKALIVVAAEEDGAGIGRVRIRTIPNASGDSLMAFVGESIEPGSVVHTDGWLGYEPLEGDGYRHEVSYLEGQPARASKLLPRVHRVVSLVKRWILGTHQGAVSHEHLDSYLDEFAFRFNRRKSRSRGKLFYRLVQQAVAVPPAPYKSLVGGTATRATDDHNM